MNILITGAKGFVGRNLVEALKNIRDGKDKMHPDIMVDEIYEYSRETDIALLDKFCANADFVFHLAGVNRPKDIAEFMTGNAGFTELLLEKLKEYHNSCPVMLASSIQASLEGRYANSDYGKSKLAGEELLFQYGADTRAPVLVYRFPNLFGKWCKPNYNSVIATFCHNIAHDLPIQINDKTTELELLYIDDLVEEMLYALSGRAHRCDYESLTVLPQDNGQYCYAPATLRVTLGEIAELLYQFKEQPSTLILPTIPQNSFAKKLYSTYVSYLPAEAARVPLKMNVDSRGSFTELLKTQNCGQVSVNISKPGITKGQHWHHSKWEMFMVVAGTGLIQMRKIGTDEVLEYYVSGDKIEAVYMLPGYTHNIINLSETEDLVTVMWANEQFDQAHPDTFYEEVQPWKN